MKASHHLRWARWWSAFTRVLVPIFVLNAVMLVINLIERDWPYVIVSALGLFITSETRWFTRRMARQAWASYEASISTPLTFVDIKARAEGLAQRDVN